MGVAQCTQSACADEFREMKLQCTEKGCACTEKGCVEHGCTSKGGFPFFCTGQGSSGQELEANIESAAAGILPFDHSHVVVNDQRSGGSVLVQDERHNLPGFHPNLNQRFQAPSEMFTADVRRQSNSPRMDELDYGEKSRKQSDCSSEVIHRPESWPQDVDLRAIEEDLASQGLATASHASTSSRASKQLRLANIKAAKAERRRLQSLNKSNNLHQNVSEQNDDVTALTDNGAVVSCSSSPRSCSSSAYVDSEGGSDVSEILSQLSQLEHLRDVPKAEMEAVLSDAMRSPQRRMRFKSQSSPLERLRDVPHDDNNFCILQARSQSFSEKSQSPRSNGDLSESDKVMEKELLAANFKKEDLYEAKKRLVRQIQDMEKEHEEVQKVKWRKQQLEQQRQAAKQKLKNDKAAEAEWMKEAEAAVASYEEAKKEKEECEAAQRKFGETRNKLMNEYKEKLQAQQHDELVVRRSMTSEQLMRRRELDEEAKKQGKHLPKGL